MINSLIKDAAEILRQSKLIKRVKAHANKSFKLHLICIVWFVLRIQHYITKQINSKLARKRVLTWSLESCFWSCKGCMLWGKLPKGDGGDWDRLLMLPRWVMLLGGMPIGIEEVLKQPDVDRPALRELLTELLSMSLSSSLSILLISKSSRWTSSKALPVAFKQKQRFNSTLHKRKLQTVFKQY